MCFAVPLKVIKKKGEKWLMEDGRVVRSVISGKVNKDDYLICQHDLAVEKLSKSDAGSMRQMIKGVSNELKKRH